MCLNAQEKRRILATQSKRLREIAHVLVLVYIIYYIYAINFKSYLMYTHIYTYIIWMNLLEL